MHRRRRAAAALAFLVLVAGCGGADKKSAADVLLDASDVAPLKPSLVDKARPGDYSGTQYWSCSDNDGFLEEDGWSFKVRDLRNTEDDWALYSAVLDNPLGKATEELTDIEGRVADCRDKGAKLDEVKLQGDDTYAYRSVTPQGRVDTVRAYAAIGDRRLMQLTLLGLNGRSAPDEIRRLVETAVNKAD